MNCNSAYPARCAPARASLSTSSNLNRSKAGNGIRVCFIAVKKHYLAVRGLRAGRRHASDASVKRIVRSADGTRKVRYERV